MQLVLFYVGCFLWGAALTVLLHREEPWAHRDGMGHEAYTFPSGRVVECLTWPPAHRACWDVDHRPVWGE